MKFIAVLLLAAVAYGARYEKATTRIPGSYLIKAKVCSNHRSVVQTYVYSFLVLKPGMFVQKFKEIQEEL